MKVYSGISKRIAGRKMIFIKCSGKPVKIFHMICFPRMFLADYCANPVFERKAPNVSLNIIINCRDLRFGKKIEPEIYHFICYDKKPREWVNELISGDIRNLAVGIISALTAKYDIAMGIAVPIAALIIKKQIIRFCGIDIPYEKGHESNIKELLGKKDEDV